MNDTLSTMIPFDPTKYDGYIFDCDAPRAIATYLAVRKGK